jgi:phosphatidate cytidylyltransferase
MTDEQRHEGEDEEEFPSRGPSEGVRIIGAQEAAEATGRHDVVRRREPRRKRFGDRPDTPEPEPDLPRITISSSEAGAADRFGPVPIVPPPSSQVVEPPAAQPRWGAASGAAATGEAGTGAGRAGDEPEAASAGSPAESGDRIEQGTAASGPDAAGAAGEPGRIEPTIDDEQEAAGMAEGERGGFGEFDDGFEDDSFVLPHWTEPPTGQVPKVVIDTDHEPVDTSGQPRWMDEGDRTSETRFDDLVEDRPALGALRDPDDYAPEDDFFAGGPDEDAFGAFAPVDEEEAPSRRPRRRAPRASDDGGGGQAGTDRHLGTAVAVGVGLVLVGLACFRLGALATALLAVVIVGLASLEFFNAAREVGYNPATLVGLVAVAGLVLGTALTGLAAYPVVLGLTVLLTLVWYLLVAPGDGAVPNISITLTGVVWIGFLGSFAGLLLGVGEVVQDRGDLDSNPGIGVLIVAVVAAVAHDVGGYFVGRQIGRTPLSAASPNKTQEGTAGGVLVSFVATLVAGLLISPLSGDIARVLVFALLCAAVAPLGDLCESMIKRDLGVKDMGSVLPGHGGVLDRFDSLVFVLPVAYFVTTVFDVWSA